MSGKKWWIFETSASRSGPPSQSSLNTQTQMWTEDCKQSSGEQQQDPAAAHVRARSSIIRLHGFNWRCEMRKLETRPDGQTDGGWHCRSSGRMFFEQMRPSSGRYMTDPQRLGHGYKKCVKSVFSAKGGSNFSLFSPGINKNPSYKWTFLLSVYKNGGYKALSPPSNIWSVVI